MSLEPYKCQPSLTNPCLSPNQIVDNGGEIIHELDGSVSVYIVDNNQLRPYSEINTKRCCEFLGYTFDVENQKCLWSESDCDTCEIKVTINPNGDDGDYFYVGDNSDCSLDINLDYIFKFDCSVLASGQTTNQQVLDIQEQISDLNEQLEELNSQAIILSEQCAEYTNIYTGMCYTIAVGGLSIGQTTPTTICCLTDAGLERWNAILGDIKYNAWLETNGCNTSLYTTSQTLELYNEGNDFAIENNTENPYFLTTEAGLCDKQNAFIEKEEVCLEYNEILEQIEDIKNQITELENQLTLLGEEGLLCSNPIENLEDFTAWFSLDVETDTPALYETVFEEQIFGIGENNLMNYIIENSPNTGIIISGETGVLPPFGIETSCEYDNICKLNRDAFIKELYLTQYLAENEEPVNSLQNKELLDLMGGWYNSSWLNYNTIINDPDVIDKIKNKKIRISIKVRTCCLDFGLLLDNIKVTQNCINTINSLTKIAKPFGFELQKVVDNKKSWVSTQEFDSRQFLLPWRNTEYDINDHRLAINTKEIDLNIDPAKAIEGDVFNYFLNNPCVLECSSGQTITTVNTNINFQSILDNAIEECSECATCFYQKQFENYECFDLMNNEPFEFEFQDGAPTGSTSCDTISVWNIVATVDNEVVYQNDFYSGGTSTSIPTQEIYLNELNNIANSVGLIFINNNGNVSFIGDAGCGFDSLSGKSFKIDLNLSLETCEQKQFQDDDCFDFMDGDSFQFEDQ